MISCGNDAFTVPARERGPDSGGTAVSFGMLEAGLFYGHFLPASALLVVRLNPFSKEEEDQYHEQSGALDWRHVVRHVVRGS